MSLGRNASVLILLTCIVFAAGLIHWNYQKGIDMDRAREINDTDQAFFGGCELDLQDPEKNNVTEEGTVIVENVPPIYNIELKPSTPATLNLSEKVYVSFNYYVNESGLRIFCRPYSQGSPSPNYTAHASIIYSRAHGRGVGYFKISNGDVYVDQIRIRIHNADQSRLLHEEFIPVDYHFMYVPVKISLVETKYFPRVHGKSEVEYNWVSPVMDARIIDDKYAVLGTIKSSDGNFSPIIEYYDKHGNRLSYDIFGSDQWFWAHCFIDTKDDGIVIAGRIKSKLGGERAPAQSVIVKYSAEGNHLWNTIYTEPYQEALYTEKIIETNDDVYTCITGDYPGRGYLITLTPTSFSSSDLPNVFYDFVTTRDGGYILVGNMMHITKIDANGSIEWTKTYSGPKRDWGSSVLELHDGYIVAGGTRNTENEEADILVLRLDVEGIPLWNKTYGGAEWDTANHIVNVPDGFIITGQTHSFGDGGSDVWVLWITESGELYRSETYSKPGDIYTYECGQMIIQGFNQTAVVATASGKYGYEPWIIILD